MSVIDSEQLIPLVFERRAIWDKRVKEHANRNYVEKCWKDISIEMKIEEDKLKKKWKYLRDQFATEISKLKPPRSGDAGGETQRSKWQYFKSLYFLKDVIKARLSSGNLTKKRRNQDESQNSATLDLNDDEIEDNIVENEELPDNVNDQERDDLEDNSAQFSPETVDVPIDNPSSSSADPQQASSSHTSTKTVAQVRKYQPLVKRTKRVRTDDYTSSMLEIEKRKLDLLSQKHEKKRANEPEDEDLLFFKSLLPHVKRIQQENVLAFRSRIQDTVQEFAYNQNNQPQPLQTMSSPTTYSSSSLSTMQSMPGLSSGNNEPSFFSETLQFFERANQ